MKRIISGTGLLLTSVIIFIKVHEIAINNYSKINDWSNSKGKYFSSLEETSGTIPFIISILMGITGLILIICGFLEKKNTEKTNNNISK